MTRAHWAGIGASVVAALFGGAFVDLLALGGVAAVVASRKVGVR